MSPRIGLIVGSMRQPRIGVQITDFVLQTIQNALPATNDSTKPTFHKIDLAEWNLPIFDEPIIPVTVKDPSGYKHEHTRAWSREISSHDAFIFVSPQYNWGYPASLKNAIDYLFNEWNDKPGMIVTYGGHGGGKAGEQLESVLTGIKIQRTANRVELTYPDMEFAQKKAFPGGDLELDAASDDSVWASERPKIVSVFKELTALMEKKSDGAQL